MCQASLVGYFSGDAFLTLAYLDLPYNISVMVVLARRIFESEAVQGRASSAPAAPAANICTGFDSRLN